MKKLNFFHLYPENLLIPSIDSLNFLTFLVQYPRWFLELKEKWVSILYHITNQHIGKNARYSSNVSIPICNIEQRKWLPTGSCTYVALEKIVTDKIVLKDLHYLSDFSQISNLEVYHSLCNNFCQKRLCFTMYRMISRTMITVLHDNCNTNLPKVTTSDGTLRYKQIFQRF